MADGIKRYSHFFGLRAEKSRAYFFGLRAEKSRAYFFGLKAEKSRAYFCGLKSILWGALLDQHNNEIAGKKRLMYDSTDSIQFEASAVF